ncbi:MAG: hypothetical protein OXU20_19735, partial [Myxococcales bacterium]|nr:hypothetical protein [Myxococcales bacterium]
AGGGGGGGDSPGGPGRRRGDGDETECEEVGSEIKCFSQGLVETVPLAGVPYRLHYDSRRHALASTSDSGLTIPLSDDPIDPEVYKITLRLEIAGRTEELEFAPSSGLTHRFEWDGMDAFGRPMKGLTELRINACYEYDTVDYWALTREDADDPELPVFGQPIPQSQRVEFGYDTTTRAVVACRRYTHFLNADVGGDVGDWSFGVHHFYDPDERILYEGNGTIRAGEARGLSAQWFAGAHPQDATSLDDADTAHLQSSIVHFEPDGSLLLLDISGATDTYLKSRAPDGTLTLLANRHENDVFNSNPDAPQNIRDIAFDCAGNLLAYQAVGSQGLIVRFERDADGKLVGPGTIVAGGGTTTEDGPLALETRIDPPPTLSTAEDARYVIPRARIEVGPDCSVYYQEQSQFNSVELRVRRIGLDQRVYDVVGFWNQVPVGRTTSTAIPETFTVAPDGSVLVAERTLGFPYTDRVVRVPPDGSEPQVLATEEDVCTCDAAYCLSDCEFTAIEADPITGDVFLGTQDRASDGSISKGRILRIDAEGTPTDVIGYRPVNASHAWGEPGSQPYDISYVRDLEFDNDGVLYLTSVQSNVLVHQVPPGISPGAFIRRVEPPPPGSKFFGGSLVVPSADGRELHVFSNRGRHLATRSALTGETLLTFEYDSAGALIGILDAFGKRTQIARQGPGLPVTTITGPYGHVTTISAAGGILTSLQPPTNDPPYRFTYHADTGLLASLTDSRDYTHTYDYEDGRLVLDTAADGRTVALSRTVDGPVTVVQKTESGVGTTTYTVDATDVEHVVRTVEFPDGTQNMTVTEPDGTSVLTLADGTVVTTSLEPDPVTGLLNPVRRTTTTLPSGLTQTESFTISTTGPPSGGDQLAWDTRTLATEVNGRVASVVEDRATRTTVSTSPEGRTSTVVFDQLGRPISMATGDRSPLTTAYDSDGRVSSTTLGTGMEARATTFAYYPETGGLESGYLMSIDGPLPNDVTTLVPDAWGRTVDEVRPDGEHVLLEYDASGNMTSVTPPGQSAHLLGYTAFDAIASYTAPPAEAGGAGAVMTTDYTLAREPDVVTDAALRTIDNTYDAATGRLASTVTAAASVSRSYDSQGRLSQLQRTDAQGLHTLTFEYDGSLITRETWGGDAGLTGGFLERVYDSDFRVSELRINGQTSGPAWVQHTYDNDSLSTGTQDLDVERDPQDGSVIATTLAGIETSRQENGFGELDLSTASAGATTLYVQDVTARDAVGRITSQDVGVTDGAGGLTTTTLDYSYDLAERLETVTTDGVVTSRYVYDANGNRTEHQTALGTVIGRYDGRDRLLRYCPEDAGGAPTPVAGLPCFEYDYLESGELLSKLDLMSGETTTYDYDEFGALRSVVLGDGTT